MDSSARILLVDVAPQSARRLAETLAPHGYQIAALSDDRAFTLDQVDAERPNLLVIGGRSSGQPAFDLCRSLRRADADGALPILAVATPGAPDTRAAIRAARIRLGETIVGQSAAQRRPLQITDVRDEPPGPLMELLDREGYRALLAVPLLREGTIVGALVVRRRTPGEFPAAVIDLLQTFAGQSALAIQNARLFQEVGQRNQELAEALEQQTATGEILRVIAGSPTDVQPVLDAAPPPPPDPVEPPAAPAGDLDPAALENLRTMLANAPAGSLARLIDTFLANAPRLIEEMERGIGGPDPDRPAESVRRAAHTLKSNAATFGALTLAGLCREVEELAQAGALDGLADRLPAIAAEYARARDALIALRDAG